MGSRADGLGWRCWDFTWRDSGELAPEIDISLGFRSFEGFGVLGRCLGFAWRGSQSFGFGAFGLYGLGFGLWGEALAFFGFWA